MEFKAALLLPLFVILVQQILNVRGAVYDDRPVVAQHYTNWSANRSQFFPWHLNFKVVTHVLYSFYGISDECVVESKDPHQDEEAIFPSVGMSYEPQYDGPKGLIGAFKIIQNELADRYLPSFKLLLSVGGWEESDNFSFCTRTKENREKMIDSLLDLVEELRLDGVDFNWQFPEGHTDPENGLAFEDYENFLKLSEELKDAFEESFNEPKLISALQEMIPKMIESIDDRLCKHIDLLMLKAYDYRGAWKNLKTGISSPLYPEGGQAYDEKHNVDWGVKKIMDVCPTKKMVLGIAAFGRCWSGAGPLNNSLYQPANGPCQGSWRPGVFSYKDLYDEYIEKYTFKWNYSTKTPYLYNNDGEFITFDNERSVQIKAAYARRENLAGMMFYEASDDKLIDETDEDIEFFPDLKIKRYRLLMASVKGWKEGEGTSEGTSKGTSEGYSEETSKGTSKGTSEGYSEETSKGTSEGYSEELPKGKWNAYYDRFIQLYLKSFNMKAYFDKYINRFINRYIEGTNADPPLPPYTTTTTPPPTSPSYSSTTTPAPASSSTTNPASSSTTNAASSSTTNPASSSTTNPASSSTTNPASSSTTNPASSSTTNPASSSTTIPASSSTTIPASSSTTNSTTIPASSSTTNAASSSTLPSSTSTTESP